MLSVKYTTWVVAGKSTISFNKIIEMDTSLKIGKNEHKNPKNGQKICKKNIINLKYFFF